MNSPQISKQREFLFLAFCFSIILLVVWRIYSVSFIDSLLFFAALAFLFIIPGIVMLRKLQSRFSLFEFLILSTITGIAGAGLGNLVVGNLCQRFIADQCPSVRPFSFIWGGVFSLLFLIRLIQGGIKLPSFRTPGSRHWLYALFIVLFVLYILVDE